MNEPLGDMLTCVVLAPVDQPVDPMLHAMLSEKNWSARVEHDPRMAMAEACLARRERQLRAAWQTHSGLIPGLVILSHPRADEVDSMRTAMERHVPDIPIWTCRTTPLNHSTTPHEPATRSSRNRAIRKRRWQTIHLHWCSTPATSSLHPSLFLARKWPCCFRNRRTSGPFPRIRSSHEQGTN